MLSSTADVSNRYFNGYIDELRFTKGIARYIGNFNVPTTKFLEGKYAIKDSMQDNVVLLLHMDGPNNSTVFTDVKGHTISVNGNAQISTAQGVFGGASAVFDGSGDYLAITDSSEWDLPGDFTIECWLRLNSVASVRSYVAGNTGFGLSFIAMDGASLMHNITGSSTTSLNTLSINTWYHVAFVRAGSNVDTYVNGIKDDSLHISFAGTLLPAGIYIGGQAGNGWYGNGYIDEVRITKGIARYTANFTVPIAAFPND